MAPLTHQLVPLQHALPGHAFDGHLQAHERRGLSSSPAPPRPWPSSRARPSRPLTGLPSERRMPEKTVPKPPLPSCGPSWYSSCSLFFCPAAKTEPSALRPGPPTPGQVAASEAGRATAGHGALTCFLLRAGQRPPPCSRRAGERQSWARGARRGGCRSRSAAGQGGTVAVPGVVGWTRLLRTAGATARGFAQGSARSSCKPERGFLKPWHQRHWKQAGARLLSGALAWPGDAPQEPRGSLRQLLRRSHLLPERPSW